MEASALTHASRLGLLGRRSPLLRLQGDARLIALIRDGQERAFETLFERYQGRLLAFCRGMLSSAEDAEDVLQDVFVAAHKAILADNRPINARPWLYRIARNRCLNHLRKPVPEGQDSMDVHPHLNGVSVDERVEKREEFRALIADVQGLPETQRTALLLREIEALAYEEIAVAMDTTVPAVKSLLVRARMALADCSQGRQLTCDEVHLELAEAAEGLRKASGPVRAHIKRCEPCREYRSELRRNGKSLAALAPLGPLAALQATLLAKLGLGGGNAAAGGGGMGLAGGAAAGGIGGAIGTKAAAGVASMAILTAGAVEVKSLYSEAQPQRAPADEAVTAMADVGPALRAREHVAPQQGTEVAHSADSRDPAAESEKPLAKPGDPAVPAPVAGEEDAAAAESDGVAGGAETGTGSTADSPASSEPAATHPIAPEPPATSPPVPPPSAQPPIAEPPPPVSQPPAVSPAQ